MELLKEEGSERGFVSRLASTVYMIMYVLCCLSFDVSVVNPLNDSRIYSELSRIRGVTGNVAAE